MGSGGGPFGVSKEGWRAGARGTVERTALVSLMVVEEPGATVGEGDIELGGGGE